MCVCLWGLSAVVILNYKSRKGFSKFPSIKRHIVILVVEVLMRAPPFSTFLFMFG